MSKQTIRELLRDIRLMPEAAEAANIGLTLAERVEAVLRFCREQKATFEEDLEHSDPVVRALARGRTSAAEQVLCSLNGEHHP